MKTLVPNLLGLGTYGIMGSGQKAVAMTWVVLGAQNTPISTPFVRGILHETTSIKRSMALVLGGIFSKFPGK